MKDGIDIPNLPGYVSIKEAADLLGVSDKRVYQYVRAGRLPAISIWLNLHQGIDTSIMPT